MDISNDTQQHTHIKYMCGSSWPTHIVRTFWDTYRYIYLTTAWGRNRKYETWVPRGNDSLK